MSFGILVDSAQDLRKEIVIRENIEVVPTKIIVSQKEYRDFFELTSEELTRFIQEGHYPTTSQPSPGEYFEAFERLAKTHDEILAFAISSKLSGTYQAMVLAAKEFMELEDVKIHCFDTLSVSLGSGAQVMSAIELRKQGKSIHEVLPVIKEVRDSLQAFILFHSLEYLRKGGRISRVKEVVGRVFHAKPIISIVNGLLVPTSTARGWENGIKKILTGLLEERKKFKNAMFVVAHYDAPEGLELVNEIWDPVFKEQNDPVFYTKIGPTLLCHAGPKVFGAGVTALPEGLTSISLEP